MKITKRLIRQKPSTLYSYSWTRNSCYIDSVLWVLFAPNTRFIVNKMLFPNMTPEKLHAIGSCGSNLNDLNERIFLEFQMMFRKIALYFRTEVGTKNTCLDFRNLYKKWHNDTRCLRIKTKEKFYTSEQHESQEFLQFILSLYGMNGLISYGAVSIESFYYGVSGIPRQTATVWKHIRDRKDKTQSLIWNVPFHTIYKTPTQERTLENFLTSHEENWNVSVDHKGCNFNCVKTVHTLNKFADLLIISLQRINPIREDIHHFRIHVNEYLTDSHNKRVNIFAIICHSGVSISSGHYTAYLKVGDTWWFYDDMELPIKNCGNSLQNLKNISTHGVLFFYTS